MDELDPRRADDALDAPDAPDEVDAPGQAGPFEPGAAVGPGDPALHVSGFDDASLERKLATLPIIEQAKGMLMGYYGVDADQAFALLRRWSASSHVKLRDLCQHLVSAAATPDPRPYGGLRRVLHALQETGPRRENP